MHKLTKTVENKKSRIERLNLTQNPCMVVTFAIKNLLAGYDKVELL